MKKLMLGAALAAVALAPIAGAAAEAKTAAKSAAATTAVKAEAYPKDALLIDDFENGGVSKLGTGWFSGCDTNNLGTKLEPQPFKVTPGGCPLSPANCGWIKGHYGKNQAPWPWAQLSIDLAPKSGLKDISGYKALYFYAKGDMKNYKVTLVRDAVKDYADFAAPFFAGKTWTLKKVELKDFAQPSDWGKKIPAAWNDVKQVKWSPAYPDVDFELAIDQVALVK